MPQVDLTEEQLAALRKTLAGEKVTENIYVTDSPLTVGSQQNRPTNRYAVKAWGGATKEEFDIECPSGQWCRAHALTMEDAMSLGMLDSLDLFTSTLMEPVLKTQEAQEEAEAERNAGILNGLKDPQKRASFFGTVNRIVSHCVVNPKVVLEDPGDLPEGTVFANDIPFADKMHIFRRVFSGGGGNATMNSFREESSTGVGSVSDVADVQDASE